jgi:hypothetical protein
VKQEVEKQRKLLRKIFSVIDPKLSIIDVTNHVDVLSGLILQAQKDLTNDLRVGDLKIDLSPKAAPHPELLKAVYDVIKDEKAPDEVSALLVRFMDHIKYQVKEVAFIEKEVGSVDLEMMLK